MLPSLRIQLRDADLDYKFAQLFTHSGGFFSYCADESEGKLLQTLNQIIKIEQINDVFCWDQDLRNFLDVIKCKYSPELTDLYGLLRGSDPARQLQIAEAWLKDHQRP